MSKKKPSDYEDYGVFLQMVYAYKTGLIQATEMFEFVKNADIHSSYKVIWRVALEKAIARGSDNKRKEVI